MIFRSATFEHADQADLLLPGKHTFFDAYHADFRVENVAGGVRYQLYLHPKQDLTVRRLELVFELPDRESVQLLANGWQSWSETRMRSADQPVPGMRAMARPFMGLYGDEHIPGIPRGKGFVHTWTYAVLQAGRTAWFAGSLNERTGMTLFLYDAAAGVLRVRKDMDGLLLTHSFPALDIWVSRGGQLDTLDRYADLLACRPAPVEPALGWTSWYRHFNRIDEALIRHNLAGVQQSGLPFSWFQIDDGWQTAVGDWLSVKPVFPEGMGALAGRIRAAGLQPGLWLAPFVASAQSETAKKHPDWLLKAPDGRPLRAGWNPLWGGWYHALNCYHPGVQEYLAGVFHQATERWGYALLKLDFLFAVALAPPPEKTRGQVLHDALVLLRQLAGNRKILACGVPLGAAFGLVDYCRVSGDTHTAWRHPLLTFLRFRERIGADVALRSTLSRWALDGRVFHSDPDVFFLRRDHQKLNPDQQHTLLTVNALLGSLLFCSDDVGAYGDVQKATLREALSWQGAAVQAVSEIAPDLYRITFRKDGQACRAFVNLTARAQDFYDPAVGSGRLRPFETLLVGA
jgi:alpha-galactosidase